MNIVLRKILGRTKELDEILDNLEKEKEKKNPPTKFQRVKRKVKKGIWTGVKLYLAAHLLVSVATIGDYFLFSRDEILQKSQTTSNLDIKKYKISIYGKEKQLTLVGETHFYNKIENKIAQELVDQHEHFATEDGTRSNMSLGNTLFWLSTTAPTHANSLYYVFGTDRWYSSISEIAEKKHKVYGIETSHDVFEKVSAKEKIYYFLSCWTAGLSGPISYHTGKKDNRPFWPVSYAKLCNRNILLDERDPVMAEGLIRILEQEDVDKLLANVGKAHMPGIIRYLKENADIEKIK